jgi:hypothetical protein
VQVVWGNCYILPEAERKTCPDAFIDRVTDIPPNPERTQNIKIDRACDRHRELNVCPLLIVSPQRLRRCEAKKHQQGNAHKRGLPQFVPLALCSGRTVNDVSATTTRSPTCNLMALASGLGRVAMIAFVAWLSGV